MMAVFFRILVRWMSQVVAYGALFCACGNTDSSTPSAVVLITVDTLRADHVSFNGYARNTTPFLDSLANRGVIFSQAFAPSSWTPLSMASLFTSLHARSHGVTYSAFIKEKGYPRPALSDELTTLAERLKAAGYRTVGVPANVHLSARLGFNQGFDTYFSKAPMMGAGQLSTQVRKHMEQAFGNEWRSDWRKNKLFLWIHYLDPHSPYDPYEPFVRELDPRLLTPFPGNPARMQMTEIIKQVPRTPESVAQISVLYDSEIKKVDDQISTLWQEFGFDDSVLFIFTSDHGEEMLEHGDWDHAKTLYTESVHVPLVFFWPKKFAGGTHVAAPVSLLDVQPTMLDLLGLPEDPGFQGRSLASALEKAVSLNPQPLLCEIHRPGAYSLTSIRDGQHRLILREERAEGKSGETLELFDLAVDPSEKVNLAAQDPTRAEALKKALGAARDALPASKAASAQVVPDVHDMEELRALGYIGQ